MSKRDDILGSYRLTRQIARGNATLIWEAIKLGTTERFVIKVLDDKNRGNKEEAVALKLEYDVGHELDHPNVIHIYEFATKNPAYEVLEIFSVLNLKQVIRDDRKRLLYEFDKVSEQCAAGLGHLHSKGWVHCDVKPDNFLINETNVVKLIDFTIAKKAAKGFFGRMFGGNKVIRGTRSYMSPEQIRGQPLDERADVYSFACVLFEILSSKPPFTAINPNELLTKHLSAPIPNVQVQNSNVSSDFADLLRRMMSKKVEDRPKTMADVLGQMKSIRTYKTPMKPPEEEAKK